MEHKLVLRIMAIFGLLLFAQPSLNSIAYFIETPDLTRAMARSGRKLVVTTRPEKSKTAVEPIATPGENQPESQQLAASLHATAIKPANLAPAPAPDKPLRQASWTIGDLIVESTSVTRGGFVEYKVRGVLKANPVAGGGIVMAKARSVTPDVTVVAQDMHFSVRAGDDLDALSKDAIIVRLPGGQSFDSSTLAWTIQSAEPAQE